MRRKSKYGAVKTNGRDSAKEDRRYHELLLLQRAGIISDLQTQVKFVLIPAQRELGTEVYKRGPKKGQLKPGPVIEHECAYIADFVYTNTATGMKFVEDSKGFRTKDYIIKRKLMLYLKGIRIYET